MGFFASIMPFLSNLGGFAEKAAPLIGVGANLLGSHMQSRMAEDQAKQNKRAYQSYLSTINPPQEVLDTRYEQAKNQILTSAPEARRRLDDRLAARGIRGRGTTSPITGQEGQIQDAMNNAWFQTYGNYNVPSGPGPSGFAPSTGQLFGTNMAQMINYLLPYWMMRNNQRPDNKPVPPDQALPYIPAQ